MSDARITNGYRTKAATTIRTLDALSRSRALSDAESDRLWRAIRVEQQYLAHQAIGLAIAGHEADKARANAR